MFDRGKAPERFIEDLLAAWEKHGASVLDQLRKESPRAFLALCGAIAIETLRAEKR